MLSLNGLPCCESSVMKVRLNCLESAQVSAAAAIGSIGSIFDVSMVRGGRQQRVAAERGAKISSCYYRRFEVTVIRFSSREAQNWTARLYYRIITLNAFSAYDAAHP